MSAGERSPSPVCVCVCASVDNFMLHTVQLTRRISSFAFSLLPPSHSCTAVTQFRKKIKNHEKPLGFHSAAQFALNILSRQIEGQHTPTFHHHRAHGGAEASASVCGTSRIKRRFL